MYMKITDPMTLQKVDIKTKKAKNIIYKYQQNKKLRGGTIYLKKHNIDNQVNWHFISRPPITISGIIPSYYSKLEAYFFNMLFEHIDENIYDYFNNRYNDIFLLLSLKDNIYKTHSDQWYSFLRSNEINELLILFVKNRNLKDLEFSLKLLYNEFVNRTLNEPKCKFIKTDYVDFSTCYEYFIKNKECIFINDSRQLSILITENWSSEIIFPANIQNSKSNNMATHHIYSVEIFTLFIKLVNLIKKYKNKNELSSKLQKLINKLNSIIFIKYKSKPFLQNSYYPKKQFFQEKF